MNYPVDVIIYINKFKESFDSDVYQDMLDDFGIPADYKDKFDETFLNEVARVSNANFEEMGLAEVSVQQVDDALGLAVVDYHLRKMEQVGILEKLKDPTDPEPKYQLTDKGHIIKLTNNIGLN